VEDISACESLTLAPISEKGSNINIKQGVGKPHISPTHPAPWQPQRSQRAS
jgi:hypothetical protein